MGLYYWQKCRLSPGFRFFFASLNREKLCPAATSKNHVRVLTEKKIFSFMLSLVMLLVCVFSLTLGQFSDSLLVMCLAPLVCRHINKPSAPGCKARQVPSRKQAERCHGASVKAPVWPFQSRHSHSNPLIRSPRFDILLAGDPGNRAGRGRTLTCGRRTVLGAMFFPP